MPAALELPPEQQRHYLFKNVCEFFAQPRFHRLEGLLNVIGVSCAD